MQPIKVKTSGFENLCAFYALFNSIGGKPREIRQEVYKKMGLNSNVADQYFVESIFPLVEDFDRISEFKGRLESNDALALSEILKYQKEMFVPKDLDSSEMTLLENEVKRNLELRWQNPEMKKELIDEYANFLFCENRAGVDFEKFPNATRQSSPYNLQEFAELMKIYQNSRNSDLLDSIDSSISFSKSGEDLVPSVGLKFLANFCHQKLWINNWQNESRIYNREELERFTGGIVEDSLINQFGASDNLHQQDLNFLVQKLGLKLNLNSYGRSVFDSDRSAINISNIGQGHYTGLVDFSCLEHKGDEVYQSSSDRGLAPLTYEMMTALSFGPVQSQSKSSHAQPSIEEQYKKACMDLINDENIKYIFRKNSSNNERTTIHGVSFFMNESMHNCIELNGNIFALNMPRLNPNAKDNDVGSAKSDLIRNVEYLKNLSKKPSQATSQASASSGVGVGAAR